MKKITIISYLILLLSCYVVTAQPLVISGLVIDQTKTRIGREFYEDFYQMWQEVPADIKDDLNLIIKEFYDPRYGFRIEITSDNMVIYRGILAPRSDDIKQKAKEALEYAIEFALTQRQTKQEFY
ncbi:curli production assembly/transport component CsgE [Thermosulfidibacter takaii ABI70S6]|uniref:Curli production assembly/transport component CsgE n=1 Tax=Thermosulfidibacter takaii (strain DSM 17441 / JCM 13301 / NBRC 103674 / ABI70S6) TaxID=1298851 RepID=A0A0S3QTX6_THET7|nr:CsgE family curli-type amyloid fiber assembly protein [Thermosulfidibacter takaii]BAT71790.1 curli production assembly/transport component CsgE [Thermosulfidibacter takaii ABI70S6]